VRCGECETEPLTPGHYCECCGRKLSEQERRALEASPVTARADQPAPSHRAVSGARCESCGGPSADGGLCRSCQQAFAPLLGGTTLPPSSETAPAANGKSEVKAGAVKTDAAKAESARAVAASVVAARAAAAMTAAAKSERVRHTMATNPAGVSTRPIVPALSHRHTRSLVFAAAALVVAAAIGAPQAAGWLGSHWPPKAAGGGQPARLTPEVDGVTAAGHQATRPRTHSAKAVTTGASGSAPLQANASAQPIPTPSARPREAVRQPSASARQVAPVAAPGPATKAPVLVTAPPAALAVAEAPRSIAPAAPIGRFFEPTDVDVSPKIATRVEPQVPVEFPVGSPSDVVVVRVLVSQTGHAFRVSLLRGSKLGRSLDEAVVAAVTQWTFSPARKRGEAVSCWYNIGVPLGRAN
jgi:hypothetical protein